MSAIKTLAVDKINKLYKLRVDMLHLINVYTIRFHCIISWQVVLIINSKFEINGIFADIIILYDYNYRCRCEPYGFSHKKPIDSG